METIESTGATIQEAISAGMQKLGVDNPSQVMVEVVQEPDQGIMGHGVRPAIVRLMFLGTRASDRPVTQIVTAPRPEPTPIVIRSNTPPPPPAAPVEYEYDEDEEAEAESVETTIVYYEEADEDAQVGQQVLEEILSRMEIEGKVVIHRAQSTRDGEHTHWILNVTGSQMNRLIGRYGETLTALQYITRLIVSRRLQRRANIIVDAGGYKAKRSERLRQLAHRMADQATRQGRVVTLEPMPPHERRIIHLTLRKRSDVTTKSIGEGKDRKVTINPAR